LLTTCPKIIPDGKIKLPNLLGIDNLEGFIILINDSEAAWFKFINIKVKSPIAFLRLLSESEKPIKSIFIKEFQIDKVDEPCFKNYSFFFTPNEIVSNSLEKINIILNLDEN
jgi:hypothetical protein